MGTGLEGMIYPRAPSARADEPRAWDRPWGAAGCGCGGRWPWLWGPGTAINGTVEHPRRAVQGAQMTLDQQNRYLISRLYSIAYANSRKPPVGFLLVLK